MQQNVIKVYSVKDVLKKGNIMEDLTKMVHYEAPVVRGLKCELIIPEQLNLEEINRLKNFANGILNTIEKRIIETSNHF